MTNVPSYRDSHTGIYICESETSLLYNIRGSGSTALQNDEMVKEASLSAPTLEHIAVYCAAMTDVLSLYYSTSGITAVKREGADVPGHLT